VNYNRHYTGKECLNELLSKWVYRALQGSIICSFILLVVGTVMLGFSPAGFEDSEIVFGDVVEQVTSLDPLGLVILGVLAVLVAPLLGIVAVVITLAIQRDWRYVLVAIGIVCILMISLYIGIS